MKAPLLLICNQLQTLIRDSEKNGMNSQTNSAKIEEKEKKRESLSFAFPAPFCWIIKW